MPPRTSRVTSRTWVTLPNSARTARSARSRDSPRAIRSAVATRRGEASASSSPSSRALLAPPPPRGARGNRLAAPRRQRIDPNPLVVLRKPPLGGDPAPALQPMQGGIERAGVHLERVTRRRPDQLGQAASVPWPEAQGLEDDQVEGALQQLEAGRGAGPVNGV